MKDPSLLGFFKDYLKKESWNDVLRCAALDAIGILQLGESFAILKEYSRYGYHPNVRMTAIRRLGVLGRLRDDVQAILIDLLSDKYLLVQLSVVRALANFADERATDALMKYTTGDLDGRLKARRRRSHPQNSQGHGTGISPAQERRGGVPSPPAISTLRRHRMVRPDPMS